MLRWTGEEDVDQRNGFLDSFRRRFGRLPWEEEPAVDGDVGGPDVGAASDCCIGLNGVVDDYKISIRNNNHLESSPGYHKADATAVADPGSGRSMAPGWRSGASGGGVGSQTPFRSAGLANGPETTDFDHSDEIRRRESYGEAVKKGETTLGALPRGNRTGFSERRPVPASVGGVAGRIDGLGPGGAGGVCGRVLPPALFGSGTGAVSVAAGQRPWSPRWNVGSSRLD